MRIGFAQSKKISAKVSNFKKDDRALPPQMLLFCALFRMPYKVCHFYTGPGLVFEVYPQAVATLPGSQFFTVQ